MQFATLADPKAGEQHMERNRLNAVLWKIPDIYSFNNLAKIQEIAVNHLFTK